MDYILETERLTLRQFTTGDTKFIIELLNSPGWIEFIGDRNIKTEEEAASYLLHGPIKSYEENGFGLSLVETKNDKIPIGMCGIIKRDTLENPDIGFAFLPEYTGQGYAYEIAAATITFARNRLQIPCIVGITMPANTASIKLLEKIGLTYKEPFTLPGKDETLLLYSTG